MDNCFKIVSKLSQQLVACAAVLRNDTEALPVQCARGPSFCKYACTRDGLRGILRAVGAPNTAPIRGPSLIRRSSTAMRTTRGWRARGKNALALVCHICLVSAPISANDGLLHHTCSESAFASINFGLPYLLSERVLHHICSESAFASANVGLPYLLSECACFAISYQLLSMRYHICQ